MKLKTIILGKNVTKLCWVSHKQCINPKLNREEIMECKTQTHDSHRSSKNSDQNVIKKKKFICTSIQFFSE